MLILALLVAAAPADHIAAGEKALANLEYAQAADELMIAATDPAATDDEKLRANLLAGIAHRIDGKDLDARMNFRYVLLNAPSTQLPDDTPPKVRLFFESVRQELDAEKKTAANPSTPIAKPATKLHETETPLPSLSSSTQSSSPSSSWPGIALASGGALIAVAGAVVAVSSEVTLENANRAGHDVDNTVLAGRIAVGATVVGIGAAAAGAALIALE